jgi:hemerythrin
MLTWIEDFRIGIDTIDDEHKQIIDQFELLYQSMHSGKGHDLYEEILAFLDGYVENHFIHEETFQAEIGYPQMDEHKALHAFFRDKIKKLKVKNQGKEVTNHDLIEINLMIKNWLVNHILVEDKKLGAFANELLKK